MAIIKLGLIGCGENMRYAHLPRIAEAKGVRLIAVSDPDEHAIQGLTQTWNQPVHQYHDYRKMIGKNKLDAVIISTPHGLHASQARFAMKHNLHVLMEKPMTIRAADAKALLQLAQNKKRILHVGYQRHHQAAYVHVRKMIATGQLGRLRSVIGYVTQNWFAAGLGWRVDPKLSGGGMFMDTGSHLVAAILFLTGLSIQEVTAFVDNVGVPVDLNTVVALCFVGGAVGTITTIGNAEKHDEQISIHGDKGSITIHQHEWGIIRALHTGQPMKIPASIKEESPDSAFFRWIKSSKGYVPPDYALQVSRVSEAVYKSAEQKKPIRPIRR